MNMVFDGADFEPHVIDAAARYESPAAMFDAGMRLESKSLLSMESGIVLGLIGGAVNMLKRSQPDRLPRVREKALYAAGAVLAAGSLYGLWRADGLQNGAGEIQEGVFRGDVHMAPEAGELV